MRRQLGSSPRLRGTPHCGHVLFAARGIIPALAGNTGSPSQRVHTTGNHPRACGEHERRGITAGLVQGSSPRLREHHWRRDAGYYPTGSSPRLRGTPRGRQARRPVCGIIPALAGNTSWRDTPISFLWDHPRACGEHFNGVAVDPEPVGSSPRLRGTLV